MKRSLLQGLQILGVLLYQLARASGAHQAHSQVIDHEQGSGQREGAGHTGNLDLGVAGEVGTHDLNLMHIGERLAAGSGLDIADAVLTADLGQSGDLLVRQEAHLEDQLAVGAGLAAHIGEGLHLIADQGQVAVLHGADVDHHVTGGAASLQHLLQLQVLDLVNEERLSRNIEPLKLNEQVQQAAQVRAGEINTVFEHIRPDGRSCFTALDEYVTDGYGSAGENIAAGQSSPQEVVNDWMNSPGHRANILKESYTALGVGYYYGSGPYYCYWVQMFIGDRYW